MRTRARVLAACLLIAALTTGCITYTPPAEPAAGAAAPASPIASREIAATDVLLVGYASSLTLPVAVPAGATAVRLEIAIEHLVSTGFRWTGLGACEATLEGPIAHHVAQTLGGECGALPAGDYTLVLTHDAGVARGRVTVDADAPAI